MRVDLAPAGGIALALAAAIYAVALARLRRLEVERGGAPGWWFGYARDGTNLAGAAGFFLGFALVGFAGPAALVLAGGTTLAAYLADWLLGRRLGVRGAPLVVLLATVALVASLVGSRDGVARGLGDLLGAIAPRE